MGGIFGVCLDRDCVMDLFFGTDYHSHLGTRRGGMAVFDGKCYTRSIHNISNTPFRTKFDSELAEMKGFLGIGCISDEYPQPVILHTRIGAIGVATVGRINNKQELTQMLIKEQHAYFTEMSGGAINDTEIVASLICCKDNVPDGIRYAQSQIEGSMTMLVSADGGLYAARDRYGRTPLFIGKRGNGEKGYCASLESFAYLNMGYETCYELGPAEVLFLTADRITQISKPLPEMKICTFLWLYYGFPTSDYEGKNVEEGIVIEDEEENQFVWIPVSNTDGDNDASNNDQNDENLIKLEGNKKVEITLGRYTFKREGNDTNGYTDGTPHLEQKGSEYNVGKKDIESIYQENTEEPRTN